MTHSTQQSRRDENIVVVPCFNEAKRLDPTAFGEFLYRTTDVTLVFVDDGSTDDTPLVLEQLRQRYPKRVCMLRLTSNVGKAEAVRRGMRAALRRQPFTVGYWDADLATPLDAIPRFCQLLRARPELLLVMGSRVALLGRQIRRSGLRHMMGRAFATAASLVLGIPVYDTQCGAKLFRVTPLTSELLMRPFCSRWIFDVEILARLVADAPNERGLSAREMIYEYPLEQWRDVSGSRLTPLDFLIAGVDLAAIYWRYRRGRIVTASLSGSSNIEHPKSNAQHRDAA